VTAALWLQLGRPGALLARPRGLFMATAMGWYSNRESASQSFVAWGGVYPPPHIRPSGAAVGHNDRTGTSPPAGGAAGPAALDPRHDGHNDDRTQRRGGAVAAPLRSPPRPHNDRPTREPPSWPAPWQARAGGEVGWLARPCAREKKRALRALRHWKPPHGGTSSPPPPPAGPRTCLPLCRLFPRVFPGSQAPLPPRGGGGQLALSRRRFRGRAAIAGRPLSSHWRLRATAVAGLSAVTPQPGRGNSNDHTNSCRPRSRPPAGGVPGDGFLAHPLTLACAPAASGPIAPCFFLPPLHNLM
jgi:hypothetical protein